MSLPPFLSNLTWGTLLLFHTTELDDLIQASVDQFLSSEDWTHFVESARNSKSDWADDLADLDHPAAELLSYYKEAGVPVVPKPESIP